jgi:hypothetical protein
MNFRSFGATLAGISVAFLLIYLMEMLGMQLFPPEKKFKPENLVQLKELLASIPIAALIVVILAHGCAVLAGAWVINRIEPSAQVGLLVFFLLIFVSTAMNLLTLPHPFWFEVTDMAVVLVSGLIAWRTINWK